MYHCKIIVIITIKWDWRKIRGANMVGIITIVVIGILITLFSIEKKLRDLHKTNEILELLHEKKKRS